MLHRPTAGLHQNYCSTDVAQVLATMLSVRPYAKDNTHCKLLTRTCVYPVLHGPTIGWPTQHCKSSALRTFNMTSKASTPLQPTTCTAMHLKNRSSIPLTSPMSADRYNPHVQHVNPPPTPSSKPYSLRAATGIHPLSSPLPAQHTNLPQVVIRTTCDINIAASSYKWHSRACLQAAAAQVRSPKLS